MLVSRSTAVLRRHCVQNRKQYKNEVNSFAQVGVLLETSLTTRKLVMFPTIISVARISLEVPFKHRRHEQHVPYSPLSHTYAYHLQLLGLLHLFFTTIVNLGLLYWKCRIHLFNPVLLSTFTLLEAFTLGIVTAFFRTSSVFLRLTLLALHSKCDFFGLGLGLGLSLRSVPFLALT
ncbi:hypothetical protein CONPUDRAFT_164373 [Coniophora puteana RWD-64-598 SS2]|uniref:Uncharacterized protein n=1 Tax=Coniophora puteana (strain RWD-64-598) TaxID=741705 RepID=A0A5M3MWH6_CONPW|nr:uncharacterized protein CONPUDRAFT_164373 [Coniophora puteana RWD-64-598 SS2]EIW83420.1 hypothetical protein CONPUDRAFT_164373 [Coniophora puteana RWD-64-598 SS2]